MNDDVFGPDSTEEKETGYTEDDIAEQDLSDSDEELYVYNADDDEPDDDEAVTEGDIYRDREPETKAVVQNAAEKASEAVRPDISAAAPESVPKRQITLPEETAHEAPKSNENNVIQRVYIQPHNVKINRIYTLNTIISMITLCAVAAGIFTGYAYIKRLEQELGINRNRINDLEEYHSETSAEEQEDKFIDAISLIEEEELNEPASPAVDEGVELERGKLLIYDSYVGYSWVPVISGVKPHTYNKSDFHVDDRFRMEYVVDGETSSYFGIDVSSYQGDINWDAVRSDGVEFAILRVGVRGYGEEGNIKLDDKFFDNYEKAHKAGIDLGVYFYSQAISVDEAVEEAKFVLEQLDGRRLEYPVVFDWEPVDASTAESTPRTEDVMPGTLTLAAVAFCETIRDAGYEAMIYTNKKMAYIKYDMRKLTNYPVWLALYNTDLTYYYDFDIWQYGFGQVDGIEGDVDLNIAIIKN